MTATLSASAGSTAGPGRSSCGARRSVIAAGREQAERRDDREPDQPARHVVVADVPELVRDDEPRLVAAEVVEQVVVEHDALRVPEPVDVGVGRRRAPAGVHDVDLPDLDAGLPGEVEHVAARLTGRQRREPVEDRVEHDRAGVGRDRPERDDGHRPRDPPRPRHAADEADRDRRADRGEDGADGPRADEVEGVARPATASRARHPWPAGARRPAPAAARRSRAPTAPRRPPRRPGSGAGTGPAGGAEGAPRGARGAPARPPSPPVRGGPAGAGSHVPARARLR